MKKREKEREKEREREREIDRERERERERERNNGIKNIKSMFGVFIHKRSGYKYLTIFTFG